MENKGYKGLVWLIIVLIILVIFLIGLVVYKGFFVGDGVNNDTNKTTTNNINELEGNNTNLQDNIFLTGGDFVRKNCYENGSNYCELFDSEEAIQLLNNYKTHANSFIDKLDEDTKNEIVVESLNGEIGLCQDYFPNLFDEKEGVYCFENDKVEVINYNDFLKKKTELFGKDSYLQTTTFLYGNCGSFKYIANVDSFVFAGFEGCGGASSIESGVISSYRNNEELYIVAYDIFSEEEDHDTVERGYTFKKENGKYYLAEITNLKHS